MPPRAWLERRPRMAKKIVISLSVCVLWACLGLFYPCSSTKKALFSRRFSPWPEMQGSVLCCCTGAGAIQKSLKRKAAARRSATTAA